MPRVAAIAGLSCVLCGCAQLLGVDDVVYRGGDAAAEAMTDASSPEADVAMEAAPACDGPCPPTTLVTKSALLPTLATDGTNVFFRTADTVWSCPTSGCGASPAPVRSTSTSGLEVVAASTNLVVWTDGTTVLGCAPGNCGIPRTFIDFASVPVKGIAASTLSSFVVASGGDTSVLQVHRIAIAGGDTQVYSGAPGGGYPGPVAAVPNAQHVYWAEDGAPTLFDCAGTTCNQPDHTVSSSGGSPNALLATPDALFVLTASGMYIAPSPISATQPFASGAIAGATITTTSTDRVYFAQGMTVQSCSTTPPCTSPTTHHTGTAPITAIAADDAALYWIEGSAIMRLAL